DAAARKRIYNEAGNLIKKSSHLTREAAVVHIAALKDAIRRVENDVAAEDANPAPDVSAVLSSTETNWRLPPILPSVVVAANAVSVRRYGQFTSRGPIGAGMTASSPRAARGREEAVMADLKPGEDGGSSGEVLPFALQRQVIFYRTTVPPGSIVIDR